MAGVHRGQLHPGCGAGRGRGEGLEIQKLRPLHCSFSVGLWAREENALKPDALGLAATVERTEFVSCGLDVYTLVGLQWFSPLRPRSLLITFCYFYPGNIQ